MAFDQSTRNRLQKFVTESRTILIEEFTRQLQATYGMDPKNGTIAPVESLTFLDNNGRQTAHILRETNAHYMSAIPGKSDKERAKQSLERIIREQAFTVLNRLAALRMAEARGFLLESIAKGYRSKGFQLYKNLSGTSMGETGDAYRCYLFSLFDEFSLDLAVLFDRYSVQGLLFPRESALLALLNEINHFEIEHLWAEDETIGWIYQYFNSQEERRQMRAESQAPRNSRELAVRNQFFTPRYVVEFLTDNTLGRIWYEMTQGKTALVNSCRYLVRRPNEIFLKKDELVPKSNNDHTEDLSQEDIFNQPVYVPFRKLKDPRELRMLDPACGSMHFGLYAFDLFEKIYEEAWQLETESGSEVFERSAAFKPLQSSFPSFEVFLKNIPKLIIENNIHGVDIDPRAVQIAGLSLWQRAQRSWNLLGVIPNQRPTIKKSNIVCAEPMPGEKEMLREFTAKLNPPVLRQLVETIFDKMELAGEAGTLLNIEKEIAFTIKIAKDEFNKYLTGLNDEEGFLPGMAPEHEATLFDFSELSRNSDFWETSEERILDALYYYADHAQSDNGQKRLFAEDTAKGFAFIDLCLKRFDIILMNPPFGDFSKMTKQLAEIYYPNTKNDIYGAFVERVSEILLNEGFIGAITPRTWLSLTRFEGMRKIIIEELQLKYIIDLGYGVLESMAEVSVFIIGKSSQNDRTAFISGFSDPDKALTIEQFMKELKEQSLQRVIFTDSRQFNLLPQKIFAFGIPPKVLAAISSRQTIVGSNLFSVKQGIATGDNDRYLRLLSEITIEERKQNWVPYAKGGNFGMFSTPLELLVFWNKDGYEIKTRAASEYGSASRTIKNEDSYFKSGLTFSLISQAGFSIRTFPSGCIYDMGGPCIFRTDEIGEWSNYALLSLLNSSFIQFCLNFLTDSRHWHVITIQILPIWELNNQDKELLECIGDNLSRQLLTFNALDETDGRFNFIYTNTIVNSFLIKEVGASLFQQQQKLIHAVRNGLEEIDKIVSSYFGYDADKLKILRDRRIDLMFNDCAKNITETSKEFAIKLISWIIGSVFGHWNFRYAIEKQLESEVLDPFEALPVAQPGRLLNTQGFPVEPQDLPKDYPLAVSFSGVLVNDQNHKEDIIEHIEEALKFIWKDNWGNIEQEICDILGWKNVREFINRPDAFFADHLRRYSKSRRQAPIYWPLQTQSGSYTLWVYYHRLTDQTLYICINDFIEPKLKAISEELIELRNKSVHSTTEGHELIMISELEMELKDFRDELLHIAKIWKPNQNDGVLITAAPLWKLFQHKQWQNKLKETWEQLEKGEYDWSHLACSIWPDRVLRKCHKDRSLAIAHGVEKDFWEEIKVPGKKGKIKTEWRPKVFTERQLNDLIQQKMLENI